MPARRLLTATLAALLAACGEVPKVTPPSMALSDTALAFDGTAGGAAPAARQVTVSNAGKGSLSRPVVGISYRDGSGWLTAAVGGAAEPYTVTVQPSVAGLAAGTFRATVTVAAVSAINSPQRLDVTLVVAAVPVASLTLSSTSLAFATATPGTDPAAQVVVVGKAGTGAMGTPAPTVTYPAGEASGWLTATVSGAAPPYDLTVSAATAALPVGLHTATIDVAASGATNSPRTVAVEVAVGRLVTVSRLVTLWAGDATGTTGTAAAPGVTGVDLVQGTTRTAMRAGASAGTWRAAVAPGAYRAVLHLADGSETYVDSAADALDLGYDLGGRGGVARASQPTDATLSVSGLDPWQDFDTLRLFSWDAQVAAALDPAQGWADADPATWTFDWQAVGPLLVAADQVFVAQFRSSLDAAGSFPYFEAVTFATGSGVTVTDGAPFDLAPADPAAPVYDVGGQLAFTWLQTEFELAAAPFARPSDVLPHRLVLRAVPAALTAPAPVGGAAATLVETALPRTAGGVDPDPVVLSYGKYLPAHYQEYVEVAYEQQAPVRNGPALPLAGAVNRVLRREPHGTGTVTLSPVFGPPAAPQVDGRDASVELSGVPAAPLLTWSAPAGATSLRVEVWRLTSPDPAVTRGALVAEFVLAGDAAELQLPAGLLASGETYAARLEARRCDADAGQATPFRTGVPYADAVLWTASFQVQ